MQGKDLRGSADSAFRNPSVKTLILRFPCSAVVDESYIITHPTLGEQCLMSMAPNLETMEFTDSPVRVHALDLGSQRILRVLHSCRPLKSTMNCRRKQHAMTIQTLQEAMGNNKLETFDLKRTQCGPDVLAVLFLGIQV